MKREEKGTVREIKDKEIGKTVKGIANKRISGASSVKSFIFKHQMKGKGKGVRTGHLQSIGEPYLSSFTFFLIINLALFRKL